MQDNGGGAVFVLSFIQVNTAHLCSSAADSQACFTDQITSRDVVEKHIRPWEVFKEMSERPSVAGTLNSKPGLEVLVESPLYTRDGHLFSFLQSGCSFYLPGSTSCTVLTSEV